MPHPVGRRALGPFQARPLTPATWPDLEELFGLPGGSIVRGCWCMYYRRTGKDSGLAAARNKRALCELVSSGVVPGLVGYLGGSPVGWISLGPREDYLKLRRSPIMKPVDDTKVWSVVCTYVAKPYRGQGLQHRLLGAAMDFACDHGAKMLEAYPVDKPERSHDEFMFFGSRSLYERAGFRQVVRRSPTRVVMRRALRPRRRDTPIPATAVTPAAQRPPDPFPAQTRPPSGGDKNERPDLPRSARSCRIEGVVGTHPYALNDMLTLVLTLTAPDVN